MGSSDCFWNLVTWQGHLGTCHTMPLNLYFCRTVQQSKIHFRDVWILLFKYLYPVVSWLHSQQHLVNAGCLPYL